VKRSRQSCPIRRGAPTLWLLILSAGLLVAACGGGAPAPPDNGLSAAAARGKRVYQSHCITCHNIDPSKPGAKGPALRGSSRALLEARVLRAAYPPGYTPKRDSHAMAAFPYLAGSIDDLAAYLR
jgi:mono/diheme cytochrome c family protein